MNRSILMLGRGGTVLLFIGLALLLVSFIPPAQLGTTGSKTAVPPQWAQPSFEQILTPQQGLQVTFTANGTLDVYILEVSSQTLFQLANGELLNVTILEEFLENNPDAIGWQDEIRNGKTHHEYVPTRVTNATLILANPGLDYVPVEIEVTITSQVAPGTKVRNLSLGAIPIGFFMALPWIAQLWREKDKHQAT